jgi:hypothetical protein
MPTPTLKRRLQRLEAIGQRESELAPDRCRFITRAAVQHLSTDELRSAVGANEAQREGREPTSQEFAAANALKTATEVECQARRNDPCQSSAEISPRLVLAKARPERKNDEA